MQVRERKELSLGRKSEVGGKLRQKERGRR